MTRSGNNNGSGADFVDRVGATIRHYKMIEAGDAVLVGVSGGPDSVALLQVLRRLAPQLKFSLGVAHLNHGLRGPAADDDEQFVADLAAACELPFFHQCIDIRGHHRAGGVSLEERGRILRYRFYDEISKLGGFNKIATGHHREDNAEQVLMNLIRGSGSTGLAGIPPVRQQRIIRPLIRTTRAEILAFLDHLRVPFAVDETNRDPQFLRNRIRHQLIPIIRQSYNNRFDDAAERLTDILQAENDWMDSLVRDLFGRLAIVAGTDRLELSVSRLADVPVAARRRLARHMINRLKGDLRRVSYDHIETASRLMDAARGDGHADLPAGITIERSGDRLAFFRSAATAAKAADRPEFAYTVFGDGFRPATLDIPEIGARIEFSEMTRRQWGGDSADHRCGYFDLDRLRFPLTVRNVRPGDRFQPFGMAGHQKIKSYFINKKVPRWERSRYPAVESDGRVVWLAGQRIDESVKVTLETVRVMKAGITFAK